MSDVLGREHERAQLAQWLDQIDSGPSAVCLEGSAGIGKTVLWRETVAGARQRESGVLETSPTEVDQAIPFAGLGDLLDRLAEDTFDVLPPAQQTALKAALALSDFPPRGSKRQLLGRALLAVLRRLAASSPLLVAIDDEQWLDQPSLHALTFALSRLRDEPIGVLIARRAEQGPSLYEALAHSFSGRPVRRIALAPLEPSAVRELLLGQLHPPPSRRLLAEALEMAGGNPLYALSIAGEINAAGGSEAATGRLPVPATLRDALTRQLARLPEQARDPLLAVAVLGEPSLATLQSVFPEFTLSAFDAAEERHVIEIADGRVRFVHPLLASVHYRRATPAQRRQLHRRIAEVTNDDEQRARHLALGAEAPDSEIAAAVARSAERAAGRGAPEIAAQLLQDALRLTPAREHTKRDIRGVAAAEQLFASGEVTAARTLLEGILPRLDSGPVRARGLVQLARIRNDNLSLAQSLLQEAAANAHQDPLLGAEIEIELALVAHNLGQFKSMLRHAGSAVAAAETAGDPGLRAQARAEQELASFFAGGRVARRTLREAIEFEDSARATTFELPTSVLGQVLLWSDQLDAARGWLERAAARALQRGEEYDHGAMLILLALLEWEAGHHPLADRYHAAAVQAWGAYGQEPALWDAWFDSWASAGRGDLDTARSAAERGIELAKQAWAGASPIMAPLNSALAAVELWSGQPKAAHLRLNRIRSELLARGLGVMSSVTLALWSCDVEALIALEQRSDAEELLVDLNQRARKARNPHAMAMALRCAALLRANQGKVDGAIEALDAALAQHSRRPLPLELGRTLTEKGIIQRRAKLKSAAKQTLQEAVRVLEPLEASMWTEKALDELGRIGLRRPARASSSPAPSVPTDAAGLGEIDRLSPRERELIMLVAEGLTDAQIAKRLYISVKTVHSHLDRIRDKTGSRRRAELTRLAFALPASA